MTRTKLSGWLTIGISFVLTTGFQAALAEPGRPSASTPVSSHPLSNHQYDPPGAPCGSCTVATGTGASSRTVPVYRPPHRLAPLQGLRVGGGTRALRGTTSTISALVPEHTGLTSQQHPTLYWYSASAVDVPIEFTMVLERTGLPVSEVRLSHPVTPGIHAIRLADYGVELTEGERYSWSVALIMDPNRRSKDILAFGSVQRTAGSPEHQRSGLYETGSAEQYAQAGLWYDALHAISASIVQAPLDPALRHRRVALLHQVGLTDITEHVDGAPMSSITYTH